MVAVEEKKSDFHFSHSQYKSYVMCPDKYAHRYIYQTPQSGRAAAMVLGSAIHEPLAAYYSRLKIKKERMEEQALLDQFSDHWNAEQAEETPIDFGEKESADTLKDKGIDLLKAFYKTDHRPDEVLAVEKEFTFDLVNPLTGEDIGIEILAVLDLIIRKDGKLTIVDHKTRGRKYSESELLYDLQSSTYQAALLSNGFKEEPEVCFQTFLKTKTPTIQWNPLKRTVAHRTEMLVTFSNVYKQIERGIFYKNRGWQCDGCPYRYKCDEGMI